LEVAFIVVSFGAAANNYGVAIIGGASAVVIFLGIGFVVHRSVRRIPRSFLQLIVGTLLTTFGTFWSVEGLGVNWPASDGTIVVLLLINAATAFTYIRLLRRRAPQLRAVA
jgi:uncharacterized membrane protein